MNFLVFIFSFLFFKTTTDSRILGPKYSNYVILPQNIDTEIDETAEINIEDDPPAGWIRICDHITDFSIFYRKGVLIKFPIAPVVI